jgi:hypothetical protein
MPVMSRKKGRVKRPAFRCGPHGKEGFRSKDAATRALIGYATKTTRRTEKTPRRAYPGTCGYWHLTSMP